MAAVTFYAPTGETRTAHTGRVYSHVVIVTSIRDGLPTDLTWHMSLPAANKGAEKARREGWKGAHAVATSTERPEATRATYARQSPVRTAAQSVRVEAVVEQPVAPVRKPRVKAERWQIVGKRSGFLVATVTSPNGSRAAAEHAAMKLPEVVRFAGRAAESWIAVPVAG